MAQDSAALLRTPLHETHRGLDARLVPFAGWEMPLQYAGILAEVRAVRTALGLFDVSHMGRLRFEGPGGVALLDRLLTAPVRALAPGRARYCFLLNDDGGIIDDVVVYRLAPTPEVEERLMVVCNASNRGAVVAWIGNHWGDEPELTLCDLTLETAMVAVQGSGAAAALDSLLGPGGPSGLRPFGVEERSARLGDVTDPVPVLVSRTGYTGENGFEVVVPGEAAGALWRALMELGGVPCGLGARDVLRLEAGLRLHGTDMDAAATPLEAALERFVSMDKEGGFVGRDALARQAAGGLRRTLVGFVMRDRAIPRHGYAIQAVEGGPRVGEVTSGSHSPTLDSDIGMGYVPVELGDPGTPIVVDIRGRPALADVVALPFYRRRSVS